MLLDINLMVDTQIIQGRGGAAFTSVSSSEGTFLLVGGASRDQQFDDLWSVQVAADGSLSHHKLDVKEKDGFSARHGMTSCAFNGSVFLFGG